MALLSAEIFRERAVRVIDDLFARIRATSSDGPMERQLDVIGQVIATNTKVLSVVAEQVAALTDEVVDLRQQLDGPATR